MSRAKVQAGDFIRALEREGRPIPAELRGATSSKLKSSRKRAAYQLPPGVRFLTDAELAARRAARADAGAGAKRAAKRAAADPAGFSLGDLFGVFGSRSRRRRRRHKGPPASLWRRPR